MAFEDKTLTCRDCGQPFVFTPGEQEFYTEKGLQNEPQRCPSCRLVRRRERTAGASGPREMTAVTCAKCGVATTVPFVPRRDRPVYCSSCYEQVRSGAVT